MLPVQEYLIENGLEKLKQDYGVIAKEYDNFVVLNYSQVDSPKLNPITDPCRGLILSADYQKILCRSFDRFYNLEEADQIVNNIGDYTILEKEDGSLVNVWYNPHEEIFQASSRGTGYAESETQYGTKFIDIIENQVLGCSVNEYFGHLNANNTYIFELVGPENRIVKPYEKPQLIFIGARSNNDTGEYFSYDQMIWFHCFRLPFNEGVGIANKYQFSSINTIIDNLKEQHGLYFEGYVLWNEKTGHRVKIKNPDYVHLHHLRDNGALVPRRIVGLVRSNEHKEYLNYFEEDRQFFQPYIDAYYMFIEEIEYIWDSVKHIEDQKKFALKVKDLPIASILFSMKKGFTKEDAIGKIQDKRLVELLESYKQGS